MSTDNQNTVQIKENLLIAHNKIILLEDGKVIENGRKVYPIDPPEQNVESTNLLSSEEFAREKVREYYAAFLKARFENISVLTGAGSSIGVGKDGKTGKTRGGLWAAVQDELSEDTFKKFCKLIRCDWDEYSKSQDIESLLTNAYRVAQFLTQPESKAAANGDVDVSKTIEDIESVIRGCCRLQLPDNAPHIEFIKKITARKLSDPRAKIFTLNYDTLFEQAAQFAKCWVIDGFSFETKREFRGSNFDFDFVIREGSRVKEEDNYVPNVIHIYKPHGSMDWEKSGEQIIKNPETTTPVIIYPKESKYESSFEQPFFEMMLRFQQEVRKKNALLIVIGFSFYDKHIANVILEALDVNPGLRCLVITKGLEAEYILKLNDRAKSSHNLILVDEAFSDFVRNYPFSYTYTNEVPASIGGVSAQ